MAKRLRGATCALPMASAMAEASPGTSFYHLLELGRLASFGWNRPQRPSGPRGQFCLARWAETCYAGQ
ncbi:MAG: hypothetical protein LBT98_01355 [Puniceicoccales bacterium]|nr:hypothetical protein [Puniceicoccales bacterium]